MGSIFSCVAKGTTEEMLRLQAECGVESDVTDFYSGPLEQGDLVLQGQGPEDGQVLGELDHLLHHECVDVCEVGEQGQHRDQAGQARLPGEQVLWGLWGQSPVRPEAEAQAPGVRPASSRGLPHGPPSDQPPGTCGPRSSPSPRSRTLNSTNWWNMEPR